MLLASCAVGAKGAIQGAPIATITSTSRDQDRERRAKVAGQPAEQAAQPAGFGG